MESVWHLSEKKIFIWWEILIITWRRVRQAGASRNLMNKHLRSDDIQRAAPWKINITAKCFDIPCQS